MEPGNGLIVLSVGNQRQKLLCEKLLSSMNKENRFDIRVISDDEYGHRLGSGGAVLNILRNCYQKNRKLIIVNSGGMSKRSINYALRGKAFSNVIFDNKLTSLIELILLNAEKLVSKMKNGTLVCCSDILVEFDEPFNAEAENFGVCLKTDFETASRHGVMIFGEDEKMVRYLHKYPVDKLKEYATKKNQDGMFIDTGITYFCDDFSAALYEAACDVKLCNMLERYEFEVGLYSDIIKLLSADVSESEYLTTETESEQHLEFKKILFEKLSGYSMKIFPAPSQRFLHFGSVAESVENLFYLSGEKGTYLSLNSFIDSSCETGKGTVLDNVQLSCCKIGSNCFVSDVNLENVTVEDNCAVCGIKLCDGSFVTIVTDISESPKKSEGGKTLWDTPRYFKAKSYSDSLEKFYGNCHEEKYSMAYCTENADFDYCFSRQQYLKDMQDYSVSNDYLKKRDEIVSHHFEGVAPIVNASCASESVEVYLPLRINLSGTWTDAMPYCVDNGGQVINVAVRIDGKKPVKVTVEKLAESGRIEFSSDGTTVTYSFDSKDNDEDLSDFELHKAALKAIGFNGKTKIADGFRLTTEVKNIDKGSGLGTSSILLGGCFKALNEMFSLGYSESQLLKMVFVGEQIMKTGGGWQDQVGGLTPGIKAGTTVAGIDQELDVKQIHLSDFFKRIFNERLILLSTGQRHFGRFIVNDVVNRYLEGNPESLEGHREIRRLNDRLISSLENDDYDGFAYSVNKHRELLRLISHKVTNKDIEKMIDGCMEKADAVSYLGAGGGGYLLVLLNSSTDIDAFRKFARDKFSSKPSQIKKLDICYDI